MACDFRINNILVLNIFELKFKNERKKRDMQIVTTNGALNLHIPLSVLQGILKAVKRGNRRLRMTLPSNIQVSWAVTLADW